MGCTLRRRAREIVDDLAIVSESSVTKPHPGSHLPTRSVSHCAKRNSAHTDRRAAQPPRDAALSAASESAVLPERFGARSPFAEDRRARSAPGNMRSLQRVGVRTADRLPYLVRNADPTFVACQDNWWSQRRALVEPARSPPLPAALRPARSAHDLLQVHCIVFDNCFLDRPLCDSSRYWITWSRPFV